MEGKPIKGFLHYRTDLGDGVRTGVVFGSCSEGCRELCEPFRFLPEHSFAEDTPERASFTEDELIAYLREEKTLCYTQKLGISFLGAEPLQDPFFCAMVARGLAETNMNLQIHSCGMCSLSAFDILEGLVDLYVLRLLSVPTEEEGDLRQRQTSRVVNLLEGRKIPYRILLPVISETKDQAEDFAEFAAGLSSLKSVILDFSHFDISEDNMQNYRNAFLKRRIPLY